MTGSRQFPDFHLRASAGLINGISTLFKFGSNRTIDTATVPEDVISGGGVALFPNAASTISIASDSIEDDVGGTGALVIKIYGLDSNYDLIDEEVTVTGLTPSVSTSTFLRVFRAYVTSSGTTKTNVGNITLTHSEGKIAYINASFGQTLMATYTVARNHKLLLSQVYVSMLKKTSAAQSEVSLDIKLNTDQTWRTQQLLSLVADGTSSMERNADPLYYNVTEKTDIRLRVVSVSANDTGIVGAFDGYLINLDTIAW